MRFIFVFNALALISAVLLAAAVPTSMSAVSPSHPSPTGSVAPPSSSSSVTSPSGPAATNAACTQARLDILVDLIVSEDATSKIVAKSATTHSAVKDAEKSFHMVLTGVRTLARAILNNQASPAKALDQVGNGIDAVFKALSRIKGSDAGDSNVALAIKTIQMAGQAANRVIANCK